MKSNLEVSHPRCVGHHNKGVLCIIHTVEHNYIYVLVHKENNNHMYRSYLWTFFRLSINL